MRARSWCRSDRIRCFTRTTASDEIYTVQGFDRSARDQTLDMQRDLVAYDGARVAVGNRLALSSGPFTF